MFIWFKMLIFNYISHCSLWSNQNKRLFIVKMYSFVYEIIIVNIILPCSMKIVTSVIFKLRFTLDIKKILSSTPKIGHIESSQHTKLCYLFAENLRAIFKHAINLIIFCWPIIRLVENNKIIFFATNLVGKINVRAILI